MRVKGIAPSGLRYIAESCGLGIDISGTNGNYTTCRLRLGPARDWRATSPRNPDRYTGAVCFHGHYLFMRLCFQFEPETVIVTGLVRYEGRRDFQIKAPEVGEGRPGLTLPTYEVGVHGPAIADCCRCTEVDIERAHGIYRECAQCGHLTHTGPCGMRPNVDALPCACTAEESKTVTAEDVFSVGTVREATTCQS